MQTTEGKLSIGELGSTRMACTLEIMDREMAFMQALQNTTQFEMRESNLQLLGAGNELLAELVAQTE